ncbi:MAG: cyclopropane-fatty-acyl-phospholipid synthase family protein [Acidobacteriota bacterium]|nr:cyclopropane-fatty-acyl-phospholipid synthase family protein [Acidobacteriota bacterium]
MSTTPRTASADSRRRLGRAAVLTPVERWLIRRLLAAKRCPPIRVVAWTGQEFGASRAEAVATLVIRDRRSLWSMALRPELGFGEAYSRGSVEVEGSLVDLLEAVYRAVGPHRSVEHRFSGLRSRLRHGNSLTGSKANIHHHYDLGNEFYSWWLDERMLYTCAYFPTREADLEAAQVAKMDLVARKLRLQPGETVVEAGCGWGALAMHFAEHYGVRVKAFNISTEQIRWARESARRRGLEGRVEFIEDDYRNVSGRFDVFVSVGMLEHVGRDHYPDLGGVVDRVLSPQGRGLVHTIGRVHPRPLNPWIEKHIFPGAYPPTLKEMMDLFEPFDLPVLDVENLRAHYALTLEHWLQRYERSIDKVRRRYDENFARTWRLYLSGSIASFRSGHLQLFQVLFGRHAYQEAWTREELYRNPA